MKIKLRIIQTIEYVCIVPGPTMRFTQGDHVQITSSVTNDSKFPHSLQMHSIHPGSMDGMSGPAGMRARNFLTYDFGATPAGAYPYYCHMFPVEEHISRGLYGMMIIDPPTPRPQATEMVMMLNSYSYSFQTLMAGCMSFSLSQ